MQPASRNISSASDEAMRLGACTVLVAIKSSEFVPTLILAASVEFGTRFFLLDARLSLLDAEDLEVAEKKFIIRGKFHDVVSKLQVFQFQPKNKGCPKKFPLFRISSYFRTYSDRDTNNTPIESLWSHLENAIKFTSLQLLVSEKIHVEWK